MTRQEYLALNSTATDTFALHREYFAQFVTPELKAIVRGAFGLDRLLSSNDKYFNDIPLIRWDALHTRVPNSVFSAIKASGDVNAKTLSNSVCVLKEVARQLVEEARAEQTI